MAGSQKEFELLFKLKATLGGDFKNTFKQAIDTQKQLRDSLKELNSTQSKLDSYAKQRVEITKNNDKLRELIEEHERLQQELRETGEPTEALRRKLERNESQIQQTTAKLEEQAEKLNKLREELNEAGVDTGNLADENERLQKSYDNLKSSQERLQRLNEEQQKVKESIGQTKAQLAGTLGVIGGVAAAVYAGPVKAAMDYETALAKVGTIADGTKVPMETMSKEIMALSNSTGIAATALADDVYNAISAGQDTADAVNFVTYSTKLAKAGFAESAQTLDVLTTILNAYGLEADEVGRVSDMLIQTQNKGKVTVAELSSVMGKIIPTAKSNGVALEQITAGYAIMTSKGIAAAETTTYMNSMLNELGKSGTTADKALRAAAGKGFKELMAEGKSLSEVLNILQEDAAKGGKSLADVFGSAEAGKAAVALLSDGVEDFNEQVANMLAASDGIGATQAAFEKMEDTTAARMEKAKNSIANLGVVLGQQLLPVVGTLADKVAGVVTKVSEFAQQNPKAVQTALKAVAAFAGLRVAGLGTKLGFLEIKKGFLGIKTAFESFKALRAAEQLGGVAAKAGGIVTKVGPIVAIIAAIGAAIYYVANNLEDVRAKIQKTFGDDGLRIFDQIWASITMVGEAFKTAFAGVSTDLFSTLQQILPTLISTLQTAATSILPVIVQLITQIAPLLAQLITGILPVLGQQLLPVVGTLADKVAGVVTKVSEFAQQNPKAVQTALKAVAAFAGLRVAGLGTKLGFLEIKKGFLGIKTAFESFKALRAAEQLGGVAAKAGGIVTKVGPIVAIIAAIGAAIYYVANNLEDVRAKIQKTFGDDGLRIFDQIWASITMVGEAFKTAFAGVSTDLFSTLQQILPTLISTLQTAATSILPVIVQLITQIAPLLAQLITGILPVLGQLISAIVQVAGQLITAVLPVITELIAQLIPVITQIITSILPVIIDLVNMLLPLVMQIVQAVLPVIIQLLNTLVPVVMQIIQAILPVFIELLNQLMPVIQTIVNSVLPVLVQVINALLPLFQTIIDAILPVFMQLLNALVPVIQTLASILSSVLGVALEAISGIVQGVMQVFQGLITFITGVFTGNWRQAWDGIKSIFSGIWEAIKSVAKGAVNGIISIINGIIGGLNKLKIPDWVPGLGGKGINIPLIPMLAKGSRNTPDTFIAGEAGPELITNAPGRTVFTAAQTKDIMAAQGAVSAAAAAAPTVGGAGVQTASTVNAAPTVAAGAGVTNNDRTNHVEIHNSPTIVVNGDQPGDLEAKLEENNQKLLKQVENLLDDKADKEERQRYD